MIYHVKKIDKDFKPDAMTENPVWKIAELGRISSWPWRKEGDIVPSIEFKMLWSHSCAYVRFHVEEQYVLARRTEYQSSVCRDCCVEFFVAPDGKSYLNFEINCIGTVLLAKGEGRAGRQEIPSEDAESILISTTLPRGKIISEPVKCPVGGYVVEYAIPFSLLSKYSGVAIPCQGNVWKANFFKCADDLPEPHWGSWSPVRTIRPDFHTPKYFGKIVFDR